MSIDTIGNFLTIIRNGIMASKPFILAPHSKMRQEIADVLKDQGFVRDVVVLDEESGHKTLKVNLKYVNGESVIHEIKRVSTPGGRSYSSVDNLKPVIGGLGVTILSTNRGIVTQNQAKSLNVGGEVICTVW